MYYRQPEYYRDFKCIGGPCRFSCCVGWNIGWTEEEVEKVLKNPACSDTLRMLMENSFEKHEGETRSHRVILGDGMRCPFLTEDNLCIIQKELGEEYLSKTCREFPRLQRMSFDSYSKNFSTVYRSCRLSCPEVAKRLFSDKKAMNLVSTQVHRTADLNGVIRDSDETLKAHPEYLYRIDLFELFYAMISDRKIPLDNAIIRCGFIADMLTKVVNDRQQKIIPQLIAQLKQQFTSTATFRGMDDVKPNPKGKLVILGEMMSLVGNNTLDFLRTADGEYDLEAYSRGEAALSEKTGGDFWLRNYALNLLMELSVPFYSEKYSIFENYALFMTAFAAIKLNAVSVAAQIAHGGDIALNLAENYTAQFPTEEAIAGFASVLSRVLCQSHEVADKLLSYLKDGDICKPSALAVLVK
ncbi:MAG: flagellin lysine-N-methylase [Oscillospiraceae bacterium]